MREDMRAKLSIFELLLRNGGIKIAVVILLTMSAEGVLLYSMMQNETMYYENLFARGGALPLEAGFVLLALATLNPMKASKSNLNYTLRRLKTEPKELFYAETVINTLPLRCFGRFQLRCSTHSGRISHKIFRRLLTGKWACF